jgi:hypothetical protein
MNPYEVLGVPADAAKDVIRRAYRRMSKRAHPDGGGSPERFALVKRAHDLLTDDARRERLDRTGDDSEAQPDNAMAMALQNLNAALDEVLGEIEKQGREPHKVAGLEKLIAGKLKARKAKVAEDVKAMHVAIAKNELLLGRFTTDGENRMEMIVQNRIRLVHGLIENTRIVTKALEDAIAIVEAHGFRADAEPPRQPVSLMNSYFNMTTTPW